MKKILFLYILIVLVSCNRPYYKNSDFADDWEKHQIDQTIGNLNIVFCASHYRPPKNRQEFLQFLENRLRADSCTEERIDSLKNYNYSADIIYHRMYGTEQVFHIYSRRITNRRQEKDSYRFYFEERFIPYELPRNENAEFDTNLYRTFKCAATDKNHNHVTQNDPKLNIRELYPKVVSIIMDSPRAQQYAIVPPEPEDESFGHTILYYQNGQQLMNFVTNKVMDDTVSVKIEALLKNWCDKNGLIEIYLPVNPRW